MRVLMTGSSGFIGTALRRALATGGHDVVRLVRTAPSSGAEVRWDPAKGGLDPASIEGMDAVVHLAGEGIGSRRWNERHKARVLDSRVRGTRLLVETLTKLRHPPSVLVAASAIGFYGDRGDEELTEQSPSGEGFVAEVCRQWEAQAEPASQAGIRVARVRTGLVFSPTGGVLKRQLLPFKFGVGGRIASGRQWWSWISLQDQVRALVHVMENDDLAGPINLAAPNPVRNADFTRILGRVLHRPTLFTVPAPALRLVLGSEMAEELLLISQRVLPIKLRSSNFEFRDPQLEGALRAMLEPA